MTTEFKGNRFRWQQLADVLRQRISEGKYSPEWPLPSEPALVQEFGVSRNTVRRAMAELREEGLVYTVAQLGSFVTSTDNSD